MFLIFVLAIIVHQSLFSALPIIRAGIKQSFSCCTSIVNEDSLKLTIFQNFHLPKYFNLHPLTKGILFFNQLGLYIYELFDHLLQYRYMVSGSGSSRTFTGSTDISR